MERTRNCMWNHQGEITQKVWKRELSFLYVTYRHDLFYIIVKYHDYIPNDFQVMERAWNCIWNHQGEITQKVWKREFSFLYVTHRHDLFYITVKYHDYIPKGIQVTEQTHIYIKKHQRGDNSESIKARALIFVHIVMTCSTQMWSIIKIFQTVFKLLSCQKMFTNGDGYQAYRYIPQTFWLGDKKNNASQKLSHCGKKRQC